MKLSTSTALLLSAKSSIVECLNLQNNCLSLVDLPIEMCQYEQSLENFQQSTGKRYLGGTTTRLDLNMEPPSESHSESIRSSKGRDSSRSSNEEPEQTSAILGVTFTVVHFDFTMELELFECIECIAL